MEFIENVWSDIAGWFASTQLQQQISEVDYIGLFTNPWFIVPFGAYTLYLLIRLKWKDLVLIAAILGVWWGSGTHYMQTLVIGNELQMDKILPLMFGGAVILGLIIYILFIRSD